MSRARPILLALVVAALPACEALEDALGENAPDCADQPAEVIVQGVWELSGAGNRSGCVDEAANGSFTIRSAQVLRVNQVDRDGDSADDREALELDPASSVQNFALSGKVSGDCVSFTTVEGDLVLDFDGTATEDFVGEISGTMSVDGPGSCTGSGTFTVRYRP